MGAEQAKLKPVPKKEGLESQPGVTKSEPKPKEPQVEPVPSLSLTSASGSKKDWSMTIHDGSKELPVKPEGATRFVCLSDTHNLHDQVKVPDGDVLLHAGDFSGVGTLKEVEAFNTFLGRQTHRIKIVIAGNHDIPFHEDWYNTSDACKRFHRGDKQDPKAVRAALTNCIYLEDAKYVVDGVWNVWGSPWQPAFCDWAFNCHGDDILQYWKLIPEDTDILITHGPPKGFGGYTIMGDEAGCPHLLNYIKKIKPIVHLSGHIHEGYGIRSEDNIAYLNGSNCTVRYKATNPPIVFDLIRTSSSSTTSSTTSST